MCDKVLEDKVYGLMRQRKLALRSKKEKAADDLEKEILNQIKEYRNHMTFETIFEALTSLGQAPSLLYDDNGHYAMSGDGWQGMPDSGKLDEITNFDGDWIIPPHGWCLNVRAALNFYLDQLFKK